MTKRLKRRNNRFPFLLLLVPCLLLSGGCSKKEQSSSPAPIARHAAAKKTPPPVLQQQSSVPVSGSNAPSIDFTNRKDPFKPFVDVKALPGRASGPIRTGNLLPIQSYETSKFKVSGIIVGLKENRALVIDPSGKGYVVKQGMPIGNSDGRIERITAMAIEVVEKYRDDNGRIKSRTVKLTLPQKK